MLPKLQLVFNNKNIYGIDLEIGSGILFTTNIFMKKKIKYKEMKPLQEDSMRLKTFNPDYLQFLWSLEALGIKEIEEYSQDIVTEKFRETFFIANMVVVQPGGLGKSEILVIQAIIV